MKFNLNPVIYVTIACAMAQPVVYAAPCNSNKCRPASIADIEDALAHFEPTPYATPQYVPVTTIATRKCIITPNSNSGASSFTLYEDNISITTQVADPTNTNAYTVSCTNPTGNLKIYLSHTGNTTPPVYDPITYATASTIPAPTTSAVTTLFTSISANVSTTQKGYSAVLESIIMSCLLTDTANNISWNIPVQIPFCD